MKDVGMDSLDTQNYLFDMTYTMLKISHWKDKVSNMV